MLHKHTCDKCGGTYYHDHPARDGNHAQYAFQCPHPACEWHLSKGVGKKVPTSIDAPTTPKPAASSTPKTATDSKPAGSPLERDVARRFAQGLLKCQIVAHFKYVHTPGDQYPHTEGRHWKDISSMMRPYVEYKCACEKAALSEGSRHNFVGMPQTEFICFGATQKGVGEYNPKMPAKRVLAIGYRLAAHEHKYLHEAFPDWLFITMSSGGHDHAVAHTVTRVHAYEMLENLQRGQPGQHRHYLDLYGSPSPNERFNAREPHTQIDTNVFAWSAKDECRAAEKWGPEFATVAGEKKRRYYEADLRSFQGKDDVVTPNISEYDGVFSVHSIYYFDPASIMDLVASMGRRKTLECIVHRFDGPTSGTINAGEQTWTKFNNGGDAYVRQINNKTGEDYSHFDNSWMFEGTYWTNGEPGDGTAPAMSWTTNQMSQDTYRVKFFMCTMGQYTMGIGQGGIRPRSPMGAGHGVRSVKKSKKTIIKETGVANVQLGTVAMEFNVPREAEEIFDRCRTKMAMRPRTPKQFRDHVERVKRDVLSAKLGADTVKDLALGSFWIDYEDQIHAMDKAALEAYVASIKSDSVYAGGDLGTYKSVFDHVLSFAEIVIGAKDVRRGALAGVAAVRLFARTGHK